MDEYSNIERTVPLGEMCSRFESIHLPFCRKKAARDKFLLTRNTRRFIGGRSETQRQIFRDFNRTITRRAVVAIIITKETSSSILLAFLSFLFFSFLLNNTDKGWEVVSL